MRLPSNREPFHPGVILLEEFLEPLQVSQAEFARQIGWTTAKVNQIIKGKRGLSYEAALDLADVLGMTPGFWMNLQLAYDMWHAMRRHKPKQRLRQVS